MSASVRFKIVESLNVGFVCKNEVSRFHLHDKKDSGTVGSSVLELDSTQADRSSTRSKFVRVQSIVGKEEERHHVTPPCWFCIAEMSTCQYLPAPSRLPLAAESIY